MVSKKTRIGGAKIPKPSMKISAAKASRPLAVVGKKDSTSAPIIAEERKKRRTSKPFFSRQRRVRLGNVMRKKRRKKTIRSSHF